MPTQKVFHYDAFSAIANKGNPAGVVLNADTLEAAEMQSIAREVGFNETVFVLSSNKADLRVRYFTPGHEMNLCGHATIASLYCLWTKGLLNYHEQITIETKIGTLPIFFETNNGQLFITMKQDRPEFIPFHGSISDLAHSMGLSLEDIDATKPIVYGSTGTWTLLVPIRSLSCFNRMEPKNALFPSILRENPKSSVHPFCIETYDKEAMMHARHFSSPYSGTTEDAVTGTASGVMGAYYLTYLEHEERSINFIVEQGYEVNKEGRVFVKVRRHDSTIEVFISGTAVFVKELEVQYA
ncbi:PhzF family phenazine biosynthesis isomerase [Paenibacillus sp.]|uniref:PhzF family phenazine biosynthesis protein n=1 Tax=Paenibacillus sp. TaxID=58172 RepID=UPI0028120775|nr:PhzF family phenazine biosynthesis isomerase [Paenibacillus sp.]